MDSGLRRNGDLMAKTPGTERYRATHKIRRVLHPASAVKISPRPSPASCPAACPGANLKSGPRTAAAGKSKMRAILSAIRPKPRRGRAPGCRAEQDCPPISDPSPDRHRSSNPFTPTSERSQANRAAGKRPDHANQKWVRAWDAGPLRPAMPLRYPQVTGKTPYAGPADNAPSRN